MVQYSGQFTELVELDPVLEEIFFQQYAQIPQILLPELYGMRQSSQAAETNKRIGSFEDPQPFDGQVHYTDAEDDYQIRFVHGHLTLGFKVERTMIEDMQYDGIFDSASNLGQSFARKRVKDEASVFENAFSGSYLGYDEKPLVSTTHPQSKSKTSTNVSNSMGTAALTQSNLETAILQLEGLGDDRGETTNAMATHLIVGRNNRKKALELVGSDQTPEDSNNTINVHRGMLTVVVHPYITSKKWFVADGPMARRNLKWFDRIPVAFASEDDRVNTLIRSYVGRTRYAFGWTDFRWLVGSNATS